MKLKLTLIAAILLTTGISRAAVKTTPRDTVALGMSLQDCINYAYQHQDSVMNATLDVKSADYKVKETIGQGLPQINGSVTFQDYLKTPVSLGPQFTGASFQDINYNAPVQKFPIGALKYNNTLSANATQLLFSGTFLVGLQAVKAYRELSQRSLTRSKIETNASVTKAYYQVLVGIEQLRLLDSNIMSLKKQLDQTTQQNKQGFVEKIDVDRLSVQYNNLVTTRENGGRSLQLGYQMLKFQMGMPIYREISLTDKLENVDMTQQPLANTMDTTFYRNRIEYSLLQTNIKLNQLDVKSKKSEFLPTLSANGGYGGSFQENHFRYLYDHFYTDYFVGLSLNIPIFSGGQRINQLRQKEITVQKSLNDLENAKNGFLLEASNANTTFVNNLQSLNTQKRSRQLAQDVLHVAKVKYQQGVGSSLEVTQAESDFENADNQYIQALYNVLISKVDLDKAYGRIK